MTRASTIRRSRQCLPPLRRGQTLPRPGLPVLLVALAMGLWTTTTPGCASEATEDWNGAPSDEPVVVRAWVERADVLPGRPFWLTVEVDQRDGVDFALPDPGANIERLQILELKTDPPQSADGRTLLRQRLQLKAPLPGTYLIPGVEGTWRDDDQAGTAGAGAILITAARAGGAAEAGDDELHDLKPPAAPDPDRRPVYAGLAVLLLLSGPLLWWLRRRKPEVLAAPVPPWDQALAEVTALLASGAQTADDVGPYAFAISGILRRYLESRFAFGAWRMTTPEVLRALPAEVSRDSAVERAVREVLEASDRVKFAREPVTAAELEGWANSVREVVARTNPAQEDSP